jgi:hypothetical protein
VSHNPMVLHNLLQGKVYFFFTFTQVLLSAAKHCDMFDLCEPLLCFSFISVHRAHNMTKLIKLVKVRYVYFKLLLWQDIFYVRNILKGA